MKRRAWMWLWLGLSTIVGADDLDLYVTSFAADGRIRVVGKDPEWIPRVSMWSERALEKVERDWNLRFPFLSPLPFEFRLDGQEGVHLVQGMHREKLRQQILLPESPGDASVSELAECFVSAMLTRLRWGAGVDLPATPPKIETAWVSGVASSLIPDKPALLAQQALERYELVPPPTPELVRMDAEVDSFLLYRWIQDTILSQQQSSEFFWRKVIRKPRFDVSDWIEVTPGVGSLRELHQRWEVWWKSERQVLIAEYALEGEARRWLVEELNPIPRFFGLDAEGMDPHLPLTLTEMEPFLEDPRFSSAMRQWVYRLQAVRFRQRPELNNRIQGFEQALGLAIQSVRSSRGPKMRVWEQACEQWAEQLEQLP